MIGHLHTNMYHRSLRNFSLFLCLLYMITTPSNACYLVCRDLSPLQQLSFLSNLKLVQGAASVPMLLARSCQSPTHPPPPPPPTPPPHPASSTPTGLCTGVGDAGLKQLSTLTSLTNLNLDSRLFTDVGMRYIQGLTNLVALDLFAAKISDIGCGYFRLVA